VEPPHPTDDSIISREQPVDVRTIYLNANLTEKEVAVDATAMFVIQCPIDVQARINSLESTQVNLATLRGISNIPLRRIYLTTTTTDSDPLILVFTKEVNVTATGFGARVTLVDSGGSPLDPAHTTRTLADSTTANINTGSSYTGSSFSTSKYNKITGILFADQDLTLSIEQSVDGSNWDEVTDITYTASSTDGGYSVEIVGLYARMKISNASGSNTTTLRAYCWLSTGA